MNNEPRDALRQIIAKHGTGVCTDADRCRALLNDACGEFRREINILTGALEEHVPLDLLAAAKNSAMPRGLLFAKLEKRLEDNLALTTEAAQWAVETWALALGIISAADIAARRKEAHGKTARTETGDTDARASTNQTANQPPSFPLPPSNSKPIENKSAQSSPAAPPATAQKPARNLPPPTATTKNRPAAWPPSANAPAASGPIVYQPSNSPSVPNSGAVRPLPAEPAISSPTTAPRGFRFGWLRGCFLFFALLAIASMILVLGVPYAFKVMRETQEQRGGEAPRFP